MRLLSFLQVSLFFCSAATAQSLSLDSVSADIIRKYKTDIIISGTVHRLRAEDSIKAFILAADKNLRQKWKLVLSEGSSNFIPDHQIVGDRIIATLVGGHREYGDGLSVYFLVIDGNGKVKRKVRVGQTTGKASNVIVDKNKAYFVYSNSNSVYEYRRTSDSTIFTEVDLETGAINKKYCLCGPFSSIRPTLLKTKESFLIIGEFVQNNKLAKGYLAMEVFADSVTHRIIPTDRIYGYQTIFLKGDTVSMMSVHTTPSWSVLGSKHLSFSVLDSGRFRILKTAPYSGYNISELAYLGEDEKGVWLFVKDSVDGKNYIRQYSNGKLLFEKEYFSPVTWYNTSVWKVGSEFYARLNHYYENTSELKKMPLPQVKPAALKIYQVTIKLSDENGKAAAGAAIETFNTTAGRRIRYSADKKGYLKLNLTDNDFDKSGYVIIYFYYKDYPVQNRLLKKDWTPITYQFRLSSKVDDPGEFIKTDIDN